MPLALWLQLLPALQTVVDTWDIPAKNRGTLGCRIFTDLLEMPMGGSGHRWDFPQALWGVQGWGGRVCSCTQFQFSVAKWMFLCSLCAGNVNITILQKKILALFHVKQRISPHFLISNNFLGLCFFLGEKDKKEKITQPQNKSLFCILHCSLCKSWPRG